MFVKATNHGLYGQGCKWALCIVYKSQNKIYKIYNFTKLNLQNHTIEQLLQKYSFYLPNFREILPLEAQ